MEFPRLVYRSASHHKPVANADEHAAAIAEGWSNTVPEALGQKPVVSAPAAPKQTEDLGTPPVAPVTAAPAAQPRQRAAATSPTAPATTGGVTPPWGG